MEIKSPDADNLLDAADKNIVRSVRMRKSVSEKIQAWAKTETREWSSMVRLLVDEALKRREGR